MTVTFKVFLLVLTCKQLSDRDDIVVTLIHSHYLNSILMYNRYSININYKRKNEISKFNGHNNYYQNYYWQHERTQLC